MMAAKRKLTDAAILNMRAARDAGASLLELARAFDVNVSTISLHTKNGTYRRSCGVYDARAWTSAEIEDIRRAAESGLQPNDVAQRRHRSVFAIRRKASELGCPFANPIVGTAPPPLSPTTAARNYAAVAHKLERLRSENVSERRDHRPPPARPATPVLCEASS